MIKERIQALRKRLDENNVDAYWISGSDPHQSEYVAARWRTREFITGFTGSAGRVCITKDDAILWADSRYWIQAAAQIEGTGVRLLKLDTADPEPMAWMKENLKGEKLAFEATEISINDYEAMKKNLEGVELVPTRDILDSIWEDRPSVPNTKITEMPLEYAGQTAEDKIERVRAALKEKGCEWTLIASNDDVAWLTNLRADDIPCTPVFYSYAFVSLDKAILFTDKTRFENLDTSDYPFRIEEYEAVYDMLPSLVSGRGYYNPSRVVVSFIDSLSGSLTGRDFTTDMKAQKNALELAGFRDAHYQDGVAYMNFLAKLDRTKPTTEIAISTALEKERARRPGYCGPSFEPISGYQEHGAMCHYSATPESDKEVKGSGLLVLDTGGHYVGGTTDITRTLLFGEATEEEKRDYTLVLKGHLALAAQRFPEGTTGANLDILARQFLWQYGMTFFHGTGHGVGCRLNVHEGPHNISQRLLNVPFKPGMVVSDEPGLYKEGRHGIRIENLITCREDMKTEFGQFLSFETLTMVPYDKGLIDTRYLTDMEIELINKYHEWIRESVKGEVDKEALAYLEASTSPIVRN